MYSLFANVIAEIVNDFIVDYFGYKRVSNIVGFSCNTVEDDILLLREFSKRGIAVSLTKLQNTSKIDVLASTKFWKLGIFLDIRCYDVNRIALMFYDASNYRIFDELRYWLIMASDLEAMLRIVDDRSFGMSTDFVVAVNSDKETFRLYDIYNLFKDRGSALNVTFFGDWSKNTRLRVALMQSKFERRSNMHRVKLKAVFWKCSYKPENMALDEYFRDYTHATRDGQSTFGFHILTYLAEMYNFSLVISETPKWQAGDALGPILRALQNTSADLTGTPISMTIPRTYLMNYVHQAWPFRTCFIFRNPQPTNIKVREILRPLRDEVWYLLAALLILSISIMTIVLRFERFDNIIIRLSNSILLIIGALCQQGTGLKMQHISTRIAFLFILIFSLLIYKYYSASVVSARLDEPIFKINDSLNEFGKLDLKMSSEWMVYLEFFLKSPDWDTRTFYNNYWLKLPESEKYMLPEIALRLVQKGGYAYHTYPQVGYFYIEKLFNNREICELMEVHVARPIQTTFGVTANSSVIEMTRVEYLIVALARISEVGLRNRQIARWQYRKPLCRKDILSATSINIYEFAPHLLLLRIGIFMTIIAYAFEVFFDSYQFYLSPIFGKSVRSLISWKSQV